MCQNKAMCGNGLKDASKADNCLLVSLIFMHVEKQPIVLQVIEFNSRERSFKATMCRRHHLSNIMCMLKTALVHYQTILGLSEPVKKAF